MSPNGNGYLEQVYERSQKLTEALYRVTDLFSDQEPLKWLLRRNALEIFESLLEIKTAPANERIKGLSQIGEKIRQIIKVFELAASNSFISDANFQVLKREYINLADYLAERKYDIGQDSIGQLTNGSNGQKINDKSPDFVTGNGIKGSNGGNGNNGGNGRREEIISLIKERDWTSIGELAEAFKGRISEKTIQRDLVSMASEGLLLKEGEKRWRRYKLASESQG